MDFVDYIKNTLLWPLKRHKYDVKMKRLMSNPLEETKFIYRKNLGKELNIDDPQDFNEKVQWLKLNTDTSEWTRLSDKVLVRDFIKEKGLEEILIPIYGVWDKVSEIDFESLPNSFVMKSNHGSGTVIVVNNKNNFDIKTAKIRMNRWLQTKYGAFSGELHYLKIKPKLYAEQLLVNHSKDESSSMIDYKIHCINGKVYCIWVCANRTKESVETAIYDTEWKRHNEWAANSPHYHISTREFHKPANLGRMVEIAECLSSGFRQVRVDLYNNNGTIYFGEMTFTPASGTIDFFSQDFLNMMGRAISLPINNVTK